MVSLPAQHGMSCEPFAPARLQRRAARAYTTQTSTGEGRLTTLVGEPVDSLYIKVRRGTDRAEPQNTCAAAAQGVGGALVDAWADDESTYMVTEYFPLGTLADYAAALRRAEHRQRNVDAEYEELDDALVDLHARLSRATVCHADMHVENIALRRVRGVLQARAIDWEFATTDTECARREFRELLVNLPPGLLAKLPRLLLAMKTLDPEGTAETIGLLRPQKATELRPARGQSPRGRGTNLLAKFEA